MLEATFGRLADTAEPLAQWPEGGTAEAHQLAAAGMGPSLSRWLEEEALCGAGAFRPLGFLVDPSHFEPFS